MLISVTLRTAGRSPGLWCVPSQSIPDLFPSRKKNYLQWKKQISPITVAGAASDLFSLS